MKKRTSSKREMPVVFIILIGAVVMIGSTLVTAGVSAMFILKEIITSDSIGGIAKMLLLLSAVAGGGIIILLSKRNKSINVMLYCFVLIAVHLFTSIVALNGKFGESLINCVMVMIGSGLAVLISQLRNKKSKKIKMRYR